MRFLNYKKLLYQLKLSEDGRVVPSEDIALKAWVRVPAGFTVTTPKGSEVPPGGVLNLGGATVQGSTVDNFEKFQQWASDEDKGYKINAAEGVEAPAQTTSDASVPKGKMYGQYETALNTYWNSIRNGNDPNKEEKIIDYVNKIVEQIEISMKTNEKSKNSALKKIKERAVEIIGADKIYDGTAPPAPPPAAADNPPAAAATPPPPPPPAGGGDGTIPLDQATQGGVEKLAKTSRYLDLPTIATYFQKIGFGNILSEDGTRIDTVRVNKVLGERHPLNINSHVDNLVSFIKDEAEREEKRKEIIEKLLSLRKGKKQDRIFEPLQASDGNTVGIKFSEDIYGKGIGNKIGNTHYSLIKNALLEAMGTSSASVGIFSIFPVDQFGRFISENRLSPKQERSIRYADSHPLNKVYFDLITSPSVEIDGKKITIIDAITIESEANRRYAVEQLIEKGLDEGTEFGKAYAEALQNYLNNGAFRYPPDDNFIDTYGLIHEAASSAALSFIVLSYSQEAEERSVATLLAVDVSLLAEEGIMEDSADFVAVFKFAASLGVSLDNYHVENSKLTEMGIIKTPRDLISEEESLTDKKQALKRLVQICRYMHENGVECDFNQVALNKASSVTPEIKNITEIKEGNSDLDSVEIGVEGAAHHVNQHGLNVKKALAEYNDYIKSIYKRKDISEEDIIELKTRKENEVLQKLREQIVSSLASALGSIEDVDPEFVEYIIDMEFVEGRKGGGHTGYYTESFGNVLLLAAHIKNKREQGLTPNISYSIGTDSQNPHSLEVSFSDSSGRVVETSGVLSHSQLSRGTADSLFYSNKNGETSATIVEQKLTNNLKLVANAGEPYALVDLTEHLHEKFHSGEDKKIGFYKAKNLRFDHGQNSTSFCNLSATYSGSSISDENVQTNAGANFDGRESC